MSDNKTSSSSPLFWGVLFILTIAGYYYWVVHKNTSTAPATSSVASEAPSVEAKKGIGPPSPTHSPVFVAAEKTDKSMGAASGGLMSVRLHAMADAKKNGNVSEKAITDAEKRGFGPVFQDNSTIKVIPPPKVVKKQPEQELASPSNDVAQKPEEVAESKPDAIEVVEVIEVITVETVSTEAPQASPEVNESVVAEQSKDAKTAESVATEVASKQPEDVKVAESVVETEVTSKQPETAKVAESQVTTEIATKPSSDATAVPTVTEPSTVASVTQQPAVMMNRRQPMNNYQQMPNYQPNMPQQGMMNQGMMNGPGYYQGGAGYYPPQQQQYGNPYGYGQPQQSYPYGR